MRCKCTCFFKYGDRERIVSGGIEMHVRGGLGAAEMPSGSALINRPATLFDGS